MTGVLDRMIMKMNFTSSSITFSDAINFSVSHEVIHILFDDRTMGPNKENELRADALGFYCNGRKFTIYKKTSEISEEV